MPSVFTIAAPFDDETACRRVKNRRTGCSIQMCQKSNGRWAFKAGTTQCSSLTGGRQRNRNRKRKRRR